MWGEFVCGGRGWCCWGAKGTGSVTKGFCCQLAGGGARGWSLLWGARDPRFHQKPHRESPKWKQKGGTLYSFLFHECLRFGCEYTALFFGKGLGAGLHGAAAELRWGGDGRWVFWEIGRKPHWENTRLLYVFQPLSDGKTMKNQQKAHLLEDMAHRPPEFQESWAVSSASAGPRRGGSQVW